MLGMPEEVEVWYVIPALRRELSLELLKLGMKQRDVAHILGITEASVSHYRKKKRGTEFSFPLRIKQQIAEGAHIISEDPQKVLGEIQRLLREIRRSGFLCEIHKRHCKNLQDCKACFSPSSPRKERA